MLDYVTNIELIMLNDNRLLQFCFKSFCWGAHHTVFVLLNKWLLHQFQMVTYRNILSKQDSISLSGIYHLLGCLIGRVFLCQRIIMLVRTVNATGMIPSHLVFALILYLQALPKVLTTHKCSTVNKLMVRFLSRLHVSQ